MNQQTKYLIAMNEDLKDFLALTIDDWQDKLGEIEVHYDEENELVDNQGSKDDLLKEMREIKSRLERLE